MQAIGLIANFDKPNAVAAVRNVLSICRSFGLRVIPEELVGRQLCGLKSCAPGPFLRSRSGGCRRVGRGRHDA